MGYEFPPPPNIRDGVYKIDVKPPVIAMTDVHTFEDVAGKSIIKWEQAPWQSDLEWHEYDVAMRQFVQRSIMSCTDTGMRAGTIVEPSTAYSWMQKAAPKLDSLENRFALRSWIGENFAPRSMMPNPLQLEDESYEFLRFKSMACSLVEESFSEYVTIFDDNGVEERSYPVSDGYTLNISSDDFFQLIFDAWEFKYGRMTDIDKQCAEEWMQCHDTYVRSIIDPPLQRGVSAIKSVADAGLEKSIEMLRSGGEIKKRVATKLSSVQKFRSLQSAAQDAHSISDMATNEADSAETVHNVEEEIWSQLGENLGLDPKIIDVLKHHPEAREAVKNSIKLSPLYLGQRTLIGWPAWAGLIALFEATPALRNIIHSENTNIAIAGAAAITYSGARVKSFVHKRSLRQQIGSPDLIATLAQVQSIAENPEKKFALHGEVAAKKARVADLLWISWPFALYGAYKTGHAAEYILSANVNYAIEAAMIRAHFNRKNRINVEE